MGFFIFLVSALIAGSLMENPGGGFVFGVLSWILYSQSSRLNKLENLVSSKFAGDGVGATLEEKSTKEGFQIKPPKEATEQLHPTPPSQIPTPSATPAPSSTLFPSRPVEYAPPPPRSTPTLPKSPPVPTRTTAENLESFFGPTVTNFLLKGNPIARIGAIILFFGVAFALKFAADEGFIPVELRLVAAAFLSMILLFLGWKLRKKRGQFAVTLQGTGAGIFYITTFIAFKLYQFIPGPLAFFFFVTITVLSALLAVLENARSLALLALIGGFLAPVLSSTGGGSHIALFSYIALLNIGIFATCWFRSWRSINLTGFVFTFFIAAAWADKFYQDEFYFSCQLFLIFFASFYSFLNILYSLKQEESTQGTVDALMTFGTPILYSILQWKLVEKFEYGTAISCTAFGSFYIILAKILFTKYPQKLRLLVESYLTIGLIFVSLAVPFTFSGRVSSAIWALEAAALVWNGIRQQRFATRALGLIILTLSSVLFFTDMDPVRGDTGFANPYFIGIFLLTLGHLLVGGLLVRAAPTAIEQEERKLGNVALLLSILWWAGGGWYEVSRHLDSWLRWFHGITDNPSWINGISFDVSVFSLFTTLSIFSFWTIFRRWNLPGKIRLWHLLIPIQCLLLFGFFIEKVFHFVSFSFSSSYDSYHLLSLIGIFSWPLFFILHYTILSIEDEKKSSPFRLQHLIALWLLIGIATWEIAWLAQYSITIFASWDLGCVAIVPALCALFVCSQIKRSSRWPFNVNSPLYSKGLWLPVYFSFLVSFLFDFTSSAGAAPLPYIPLLNPLDLAQAMALISALVWSRRIEETDFSGPQNALKTMLGPWLFVWATATLLRVIHHFMGVPWNWDAMFDSNTVQAALSIFWSILALTLMLLAHHRGWRQLWKSGAVLIGIVVIKLFLIDLSSQGTLARIAAFLGVGILMLSIGYLAPIPPEKQKGEK